MVEFTQLAQALDASPVALCTWLSTSDAAVPVRIRRAEAQVARKNGDMTVYLAWTSHDLQDVQGPWHEARLIAPGLLAVDSTESLSAVYHAIKWSLAPEASLIVVPVDRTPKSRGMAAGTTQWLRDRTQG